MARRSEICAWTILVVLGGCQTVPPPSAVSLAAKSTAPASAALAPPVDSPQVHPVQFQAADPGAAPAAEIDPPLPDGPLQLEALVREVQSRNPTLSAMTAAWQAAEQRYPQVVSLDDPMFMTMGAPASFGSSDVESAYILEGAQKVPWFGKRAAKGRAARAEARAERMSLEDARVALTESASMAFFDYYLVARQQELNRGNRRVMGEFRESAQAKYRAGQVSQRDVLQADLELAEADRKQVELDRMQTTATARLNTLLRRPPLAPLPPPPSDLPTELSLADSEALAAAAIEQRPDLAALGARIRAEQAALTLACKSYYPDGEFFGRYDSFWQPEETQSDLRGQAGVRLNVPIYHERLSAAVREAGARVRQRRAEYEQKLLDIRYEVQTAHAELRESQQAVALYAERFVPLAEQNVAVARANYDVGQGDFLNLAMAQRQLIEIREKHQSAIATFHQRAAKLNRALGQAAVVAQP